MQKDFQKWHTVKQSIDNGSSRLFYHEREIWWCALGLNIGFEQDGKGKKYMRPVLIIKGFSREVCLCVPLTTREKKGKFYRDIDLKDGIQRKVILSQIRLIDTKRLLEKVSTVDAGEFRKIKQAIISLIE